MQRPFANKYSFKKREETEMINKKSIYITDFDLERLKMLIKLTKVTDPERKSNTQLLIDKINQAKVVRPESIPQDTVTMNSKVCLEDFDSGIELTLRLVFPKDADFKNGRISVTTQLGTALLGCRVGDTAEWRIPPEERKFRAKIIGIVYQPEKCGHQGM
jgi:regulator of nucleoside diphosphate kinase